MHYLLTASCVFVTLVFLGGVQNVLANGVACHVLVSVCSFCASLNLSAQPN